MLHFDDPILLDEDVVFPPTDATSYSILPASVLLLENMLRDVRNFLRKIDVIRAIRNVRNTYQPGIEIAQVSTCSPPVQPIGSGSVRRLTTHRTQKTQQ